MDPLVAEQRDCAAALGTRDIPKDVFSAEYPENSMPTDHFESIMKRAGTGAFPQMAADAFHTNGLLWLSYVRAGSTAALRNCWFSVLAPVGCLLERLEGPTWRTLGLVLHACEFHVILWKPDTLEDGIHYTWKPRRRDAMWTLHQLRSLDYYRCRAVVPVSPAKTYQATGPRKWIQTFRAAPGATSLTTAQAKRAFKGITMPWLERLSDGDGAATNT